MNDDGFDAAELQRALAASLRDADPQEIAFLTDRALPPRSTTNPTKDEAPAPSPAPSTSSRNNATSPSGRGGGGSGSGGAPFLPRLLGAAANGFGRAWTASATLPQTVFQSMTCRACHNVSPIQCDTSQECSLSSSSHPRCTHSSPAHHWSPADGPGWPVPPRLLPLRRVRPGTCQSRLFFFLRNFKTHRPLPVNALAVQRALILPPGRPSRALPPPVRPLPPHPASVRPPQPHPQNQVRGGVVLRALLPVPRGAAGAVPHPHVLQGNAHTRTHTHLFE